MFNRMWEILNIAFYGGWAIIFFLAWRVVITYVPKKVEALSLALAESREKLKMAESENLDLNVEKPDFEVRVVDGFIQREYYEVKKDGGLRQLRQRIERSERDLHDWSSPKPKWTTRLILFLMILAVVGFFIGKPDPITWHAKKTIDLACKDIFELRTQLPVNWSPEVNYLSGPLQPFNDTLLRLETRINDAVVDNATQYKYLQDQLLLLENSLTSGSLGLDMYDPRNIVELNMVPFCVARLG